MKKYLLLMVLALGAHQGFAFETCFICWNVKKNGTIKTTSFSEKNRSFKVKKKDNVVIKVSSGKGSSETRAARALCDKMEGSVEDFGSIDTESDYFVYCFDEYAEKAKEATQALKDRMGGEKFKVANCDSEFEPS